jgi:periplasmic protein TonB
VPATKSQILSFLLHVVLLVLLIFLTARPLPYPPPATPRRSVPLAPPRRLLIANQRSGGSNQTSLPARRGPPPPVAHRSFIPPATVRDPRLPMPISIAFEVPPVEIGQAQIGDPSGLLATGGLGSRGTNGIGNDGCCDGIGESRFGTPGVGSGSGHPVTPPQLLYKVEPEFSEEARKAKYQGVVVLVIEVDLNGRPRNLRMLHGLGLGLDERAIDAVARWRFRPAYQDGKPVVSAATVEVTFRLL